MEPTCPTCDAVIVIAPNTEVSEIISCTECQSRLVITSLEPDVKIAVAPSIEEDWGE